MISIILFYCSEKVFTDMNKFSSIHMKKSNGAEKEDFHSHPWNNYY